MKGYMYILRCSNGQYYTGSTNNIEIRLAQHQSGQGSNFTKKHLPVELAYLEEFDSIDDAFYREKQVQGWSRRKKEALIKREYDRLPELSRPSTGSGTACRCSGTGRFDGLSDRTEPVADRINEPVAELVEARSHRKKAELIFNERKS